MDSALCETCGNFGLRKADDGFVYCTTCGTQSQIFLEEDLGDFQQLGQDEGGRRLFFMAREHNVLRKRQEEKLRKLKEKRKGHLQDEDEDEDEDEDDEEAEAELLKILARKPGEEDEAERVRNTLASKFSSVENVRVWSTGQEMYDPSELKDRLGSHIREFYVQGLQKMLQLQLETVVKEFGVNRLVCGVARSIWLNFVASTRLFEKEWVDEIMYLADEESLQKGGKQPPEEKAAVTEAVEEEEAPRGKRRRKRKKKEKVIRVDKVPVTKGKRKLSVLCVESLEERLPLRATLSVLFLACYVLREPVLPSDISEWASSGKLPYLTVFLSIPAKRFVGPELNVIQMPEIEPKALFRPSYLSSGKSLEHLAGVIANRLGLELPSVNFHAISKRFLGDLGLDAECHMSYLKRLYQWYSPEGLWLSARSKSFPTRAYVMAMIIVMLKLVYSIDGNAESSLYWPSVAKRLSTASSSTQRHKFQTVLETIEKRLLENTMKDEFVLKNFLQHCLDVVFPGVKTNADEDHLYNLLWNIFEKASQQQHDDAAAQPAEEDDEVKEEKEEADVNTEDDDAGDQPGTENDPDGQSENELTSTSAAWSRAGQRPEAEGQIDGAGEAGEADAEQKPEVAPTQQEEASSGNEEVIRVERAKSRLLYQISHELKTGGFNLISGSVVEPPSPAESCGYTMYPTVKHSRQFKKAVLGDYFMLLFACSRVAQVRSNIIHRCVQQAEDDLVKLEERAQAVT